MRLEPPPDEALQSPLRVPLEMAAVVQSDGDPGVGEVSITLDQEDALEQLLIVIV